MRFVDFLKKPKTVRELFCTGHRALFKIILWLIWIHKGNEIRVETSRLNRLKAFSSSPCYSILLLMKRPHHVAICKLSLPNCRCIWEERRRKSRPELEGPHWEMESKFKILRSANKWITSRRSQGDFGTRPPYHSLPNPGEVWKFKQCAMILIAFTSDPG